MTIKDCSLPAEVLKIIRQKATETPHTGSYTQSDLRGTYLCRGCGKALFRADAKFSSGCGWPSFDISIGKTVTEHLDADGLRMEILCACCAAHLGHVFDGEGFTLKNRRYCVNSMSLDFIENKTVLDTEEAIVAAGCFWRIQYYFQRLPGVLKTEVGYTGGQLISPSYSQVCTGTTGHFEAVRIIFDPLQLTYKALLHYFFELHDPTQENGQGADHGSQYKSAIFYYDTLQKQAANQLIKYLQTQGLTIATQLLPISVFWKAELSHQQYYEKNKI